MTPEEKRNLLKTLKAKAKIQKERIRTFVGTVIQVAILLSRAKIRIVTGGNRSGKSECGAEDTGIKSTHVIPDSLINQYPTDLLKIGRLWCSSLDYAASRDIIKEKLDKILPKRLIRTYKLDDKIYYFNDERIEIGLKSCDSGRKKYQGTSRIQVWMDEEHPQDIYDEIYERTTDCSGQIIFTFTPVEGLTWSYTKLYQKAKRIYFTTNKHGIKEEVGIIHTIEELKLLQDRKLECRENTDGEADPNIEVFIMSKYDNPYLPIQEIQNSERKYKDNPPEYNARILGRFSKITNRCVFSTERLLIMQGKCKSKFKRGDIEQKQFKLSKTGNLVTFKDKKPVGEGHYIIGADVAEGLETGDYSVAQILDHKTCEQVAIWRGHVSPDKFASILIELGRYYNNAWLAPERNFHGFGVVNRIRDQKYNRLYSEYDIPQETIKQGGATGVKKYGWDTTAKTRPILVQDLSTFISEGHVIINDPNTIDELFTFVYDKDGYTGALRGCFDDRVMGLGIAIQVFRRKSIPVIQNKTPSQPLKIDPITGYQL